MRVRFIHSVTVQDAEGRQFEAGQDYDLPEESAAHWLKRGKAIVAPEPEAAVSEPAQDRPPRGFKARRAEPGPAEGTTD